MAGQKSGKRLAYDQEERDSQIDAMLRRAKRHRELARDLAAKVRRARTIAARLLKQARTKAKQPRKR